MRTGESHEAIWIRARNWAFNPSKAHRCVYWPKADRKFPLPLMFLVLWGDTEEACHRFIAEQFSGEAKATAVPWLTDAGLAALTNRLEKA